MEIRFVACMLPELLVSMSEEKIVDAFPLREATA
jgi:hypothetical protein